MKIKNIVLASLSVCALPLIGCKSYDLKTTDNIFCTMATETLDSLYSNYSIEGSSLLRENYPFKDQNYVATYLASQEQANVQNPYSYLWPYSGTLSAVAAIMECNKGEEYNKVLDERVIAGLNEYYDTKREPYAYSSYVNSAPQSDRFYDDNVWLGIDFTDVYMITKKAEYLKKAEEIWKFIESGTDEVLGGGIYWCEQKKESKNTCSNAPGSVYALKLFQATNDSAYFKRGVDLYNWTKSHLQDETDGLYYDNVNLSGKIGKAKYAYNSGQMLQSAALLYKLTSDKEYLKEAQRIAESCYGYFFFDYKSEKGETFRMLKKGDIWFTAVMLRGFIELYKLDNNKKYINTFSKSLEWAWENAREKNGLFNTDLSGASKDERKWLLTQAAMVEMYARIASVNK